MRRFHPAGPGFPIGGRSSPGAQVLSVISLILVLALAGGTTPTVSAASRKPSEYAGQFFGMGYLLFRCSSINMIHGLQLDRNQAVALLEMARVVDGLSPPPSLTFSEKTVLTPVVEAFKRLANALFRRRPIPETFRQEMIRIREEQSRLIRGGLRYDLSVPPLSCGRCHWAPGTRWLLGLPWIDKVANHPGIRKEQALSHMIGPFGLVSFLYVWWNAERIDGLLTPVQKAAVASFSCCLLPPKEFANPIRVGQADLGEWQIPMLEKIRSASAWTLPFWKSGVARFLIRRRKALHPGVTGPELDRLTASSDALIDRIHGMSAIDFELQKADLAKEAIMDAPDVLTEKMKQLRNALFLLMPGAAGVYADLLKDSGGVPGNPVPGPSVLPDR